MPAVARLGDPIACGDIVAEGSPNVFSNGMPVTRNSGVDFSAGHGCFPATPAVQGSPTVFVNNLPMVRVGDQFAAHTCKDTTHSGTQRAVTVGSPDVFANV